MRGRTLRVPDIHGLRPTSSRVREALFNILGDISDASVLDLFAGSGVMALESLSRGAKSAMSIEGDRSACEAMKKIQSAWPVPNWSIQNAMLPKVLKLHAGTYFDVIFADPPYQQGLSVQLPRWLLDADISFGRLIVEEASRERLVWREIQPEKTYRYGETTLYVFQGQCVINENIDEEIPALVTEQ
ncbi:MAG: hypothetical protein AUK35_06605 [Zetaproteobacteria bacterium CG2_30_46_52]|nr:MAG: hypothetical protein AUK35_06605 [Zetaproteobacteria bacterium CG2_30_46_52]